MLKAMKFSRSIFYIFFSCFVVTASAQDRPIGYWRSHLPYNSGIGLATDGTDIFTITSKAFFTVSRADGGATVVPYSKVENMSDVGMKCTAYDAATGTVVLVYANGNIDLYKESDNSFANIPDFKVKSISGTKEVNAVYAENGTAYISTSVGILVADLATRNIEETYKFIVNNETSPILGFIRNGLYFYAVTGNGVYRAPTSSPQLQNFQIWDRIDSVAKYRFVASVGERLYLGNDTAVFRLESDTFLQVYRCPPARIITHINNGKSDLLIGEYNPNAYTGAVKVLNVSDVVADSFSASIFYPSQTVQTNDGYVWLADKQIGLTKLRKDGVDAVVPPGPSDPECFDIYAHNKSVWVTHGSYTERLYPNTSFGGVSNFHDERWDAYRRYVYPPLNNMEYFVSVIRDEKKGTTYLGSFVNGLFTLKNDGTYEELNKNSIFDTSVSLFGNDQRQLADLALDKSGNLWVTSVFTFHQLYAKKDDLWYKFRIPNRSNGGPLVVDDDGQVWFVSLDAGGVVLYDPAGTIEDATDDRYLYFSTGAGAGNLPSNNALCIAKDNTNNIWVGTDNGIGIISNCNAPGPCDAQIPIVQYDQFAGYLFAGNNVRTIAVDGGNRKWVGTDDGVWLLSPDAQKIIYRFTAENSPLPANQIRKIAIDQVTGDVYIGTQNGMVSFRSTATEGGKENSNVSIFPNPVSHDYAGTVAIKGLAANVDVRITDINGQLVYKTKAFGGQAVWDGKDYNGRKPQSGVYLVFASSGDGSQTYTGKIIFQN